MRFALLLALTASAVAQPTVGASELATVAGGVRDTDGAPLPGASVYLSGTSRGDAADAEGRFEIADVPPGAYRLVGSMVGFSPQAVPLRLAPGHAETVALTLTPIALELGGVEVEADRDDRWRRRLEQFEDELLGESANADSTRVLNPEVLRFRSRWGALEAEAVAPLVIENRALGYRLTYDLHVFSACATAVRYDGDQRFEDLEPASAAEAARWAEARARAYRGSLAHLLRAMLAGTAEDEGFTLLYTRDDPFGPDATFRTASRHVMAVDDDGWGTLRARGRLEVTYGGEPEEPAYLRSRWFPDRRSRPDRVQRSALHLDRSLVRIDPQGTPEDPFSMSASGHMGFERLADRVPEDYAPPGD